MRIPCPTVTQRYSKRKQIPFSVYLSSFALGRERVQPITNQVCLPLIQHLVQLSLRVRHQTDTWDKSKWFEVTFHLLILPPDVPLWCRRRSRPLAPSEADKVRFYWIKISLSLTRSCSLSSDLYTPPTFPTPLPSPPTERLHVDLWSLWQVYVIDRVMGEGVSTVWRKMFDRLRAGLRMTQGHWRCLNL